MGFKKKKKVIPSNLLTFIRFLVITRPSAAVLGAMETGIAANRGGCFQLIPISEKKEKKIGFCGMSCLKDFVLVSSACGHCPARGTERYHRTDQCLQEVECWQYSFGRFLSFWAL